MENYVVTISRQFAAMGRTIASKMSQELNIPFYDRDIVEQTAKRMGVPIPEVGELEEKAASRFAARTQYPLGLSLMSTRREIFDIQANIIRDMANRESCIIVGRCADAVLKDHPRCLNIFLYAPVEARVQNCIDYLEMDEKTARRSIREVDRSREIYRLRCCEGVREEFDYRHVMIDSSRFGTDKAAKFLCALVRAEFYDD